MATGWFKAARIGDATALDCFLQHSPNLLNSKESDDTYGCSALHLAAWEGHLSCVELLLDRSADINSRGEDGSTPLIWAAWKGRLACVRLLLDRGADLNLKDNKHGKIALDWGSTQEVLDAIRTATPAVNTTLQASTDSLFPSEPLDLNKSAKTAPSMAVEWFKAARIGDATALDCFLQNSPNLLNLKESDDTYGCSALHLAAWEGHLSCVELLLDRSADINSRGADDSTPLIWAAWKGRLACVRLLLDRGADLNLKDNKYGKIALDWGSTQEVLDAIRAATPAVNTTLPSTDSLFKGKPPDLKKIGKTDASESKNNGADVTTSEVGGTLQQDLIKMRLEDVYRALEENGYHEYDEATDLDDEIWECIKNDNPLIKPAKFLRAKKLIAQKCAKVGKPIQVIIQNFLFVAFISHYKDESGTEARSLKNYLSDEIPKHGIETTRDRVFLDSDNLHNLEKLLEIVTSSAHLIVILSKKLLTRPWCLLEIGTAVRNKREIISVLPTFPKDKQFEISSFQLFHKNLKTAIVQTLMSDPNYRVIEDGKMKADNEANACIATITLNGFSVDEIQDAIKKLSSIIARPLNLARGTHNEITAQVTDIVSLMKLNCLP